MDQVKPARIMRPPPRAHFEAAQLPPVQGIVPSKAPAIRLTPNSAAADPLIRATVRNPLRAASMSPAAPSSMDTPVPTSIETCTRVQRARSCHRPQVKALYSAQTPATANQNGKRQSRI